MEEKDDSRKYLQVKLLSDNFEKRKNNISINFKSELCLDGPRNHLFKQSDQELLPGAFREEIQHWPITVPAYRTNIYCLANCPGIIVNFSYFLKYMTLPSLFLLDNSRKPATKYCICSPDIYMCDQCLGHHCANPKYIVASVKLADTFKTPILISDDDDDDVNNE